jgi:hypothetical protein
MAMPKPTRAIGNATNLTMVRFLFTIATAKIQTRGYIAMRWYQHKTHGGSFITSLKKRLPAVATAATNHAKYSCNIKLSSLASGIDSKSAAKDEE